MWVHSYPLVHRQGCASEVTESRCVQAFMALLCEPHDKWFDELGLGLHAVSFPATGIPVNANYTSQLF